MITRCPSCSQSFDLSPESEARSTMLCPHCARVVVLRDTPLVAPVSRQPLDDPGTEPLLEPLSPAEGPTQIGVASQTLSLPPGKRVSVAILSGPRKGEVVAFSGPRLTFGRTGAGADVEVPDPDVSRTHAALECHGPRVVLRDLRSSHGTFVGAAQVSQLTIEGGSEFRLGGTTFMLLVSDL